MTTCDSFAIKTLPLLDARLATYNSLEKTGVQIAGGRVPMGLKQFDPKHECKTKLRKGDEVIVLSGRSRGVVAKIDRIDRKKSRVYLEGKHFHQKHTKPSETSEGGIVEKSAPLHISNVAIVDPETKKPTKIGYRKDGEEKVRFARKSGVLIPNA